MAEAEQVLARRMEQIRKAVIFGDREDRNFEEAAIKFVELHQHKRSLDRDIGLLTKIMPYIGHLPLRMINRETLQPIVNNLNELGRRPGTINHHLKIVRRILRLAADTWMDGEGKTWLAAAPKITMLPDRNKRPPHPLMWNEQERLFAELPEHLHAMALFAVNTCARDGEICNLRWSWRAPVALLDTFVFIVPGKYVKNGDDRLIVLNSIAKRVVESQLGKNSEFVFSYLGKPIKRMNNSAWRRARTFAGLPDVRVHDLRHTGATRMRGAGVGLEDRADVLGHRAGRITTHYSSADLSRLIEAVESIANKDDSRAELIVLRRPTST